MTIKELVAVLEGMDPEREIYADGCDCTNAISGVSSEDWGRDGKGWVAIIRVYT